MVAEKGSRRSSSTVSRASMNEDEERYEVALNTFVLLGIARPRSSKSRVHDVRVPARIPSVQSFQRCLSPLPWSDIAGRRTRQTIKCQMRLRPV